MCIDSVMPSKHLILCRPLLLLPSIFPSIKVFSNKSAVHTRCQSIGASASASVMPVNIQCWFPLGFIALNSWQFKGVSRVFYSTTVQKHQFFGTEQGFEVGSAAQVSRSGLVHPILWAGVQWSWSGPLIPASSGATPWLDNEDSAALPKDLVP